jgi:hypothetical protein
MANKVDMNYRFTSDSEPTDEQLKALMEEVAEEVRRKSSGMQELIMDNIRREYRNVRAKFPNL